MIRFRLPSLSLLLTALVVLSASLPAQQIQISKDNKTIAITTSDEASAPADTATINIGFVTYGKDHDATYASASQISNAIADALTASGVPKDALQSTNQNLSPIEPGNDNDKARYAQGLRFQFSQGWSATVPADQAAKVLQLAITQGANNSGNIEWKLQHDDALEAEAAKKALQHARQVAEQMAQGLGVRLGPLVYASNEAPSRGILPINGMALAAPTRITRELKPLAISPDRITRSATVYAVFAIE